MKKLKKKGLGVLCGILRRLGAEVPKGPPKQKQLVRLLEDRLEKGYKHLQECGRDEFRVLNDLGYEVGLEQQTVPTATDKKKSSEKRGPSKQQEKKEKNGGARRGAAAYFRQFWSRHTKYGKQKFLAQWVAKGFPPKTADSYIFKARINKDYVDGTHYLRLEKEDGKSYLIHSKKPAEVKARESNGKKEKEAKALAKNKKEAKAAAKAGKKSKKAKGSSEEE